MSSKSNQVLIDITVIPKSSRSGISLDSEGNFKVHLNSPPVDGKANAECINLFSKALRIPKSSIEIDKGDKGRKKRLAISGITQEDIISKIKSGK